MFIMLPGAITKVMKQQRNLQIIWRLGGGSVKLKSTWGQNGPPFSCLIKTSKSYEILVKWIMSLLVGSQITFNATLVDFLIVVMLICKNSVLFQHIKTIFKNDCFGK
uniref:(northern house mosquito) hypothetical protein n=1 Tax=Culex pipiens TaxID=7175 RepID=A0A8D8N3U4_CULPI